MAKLDLTTPEKAFELFSRALNNEFDNFEFDGFDLGEWVNPKIRVADGQSDISAAFMEAFVTSQGELYRLVTTINHQSSDLRKLTEEELDHFQLKVGVSGGSSNYIERIADVLEKIATEAVGKLSANQIVALLAGGAILMCGSYGFSNFLEAQKDVQIEKLKSEDRRKELEVMQFATQAQVEATKHVADKMAEQGGALAQAVISANATNAALLKAASTTQETSVNGLKVTREQADLLRTRTRQSSDEKIVVRRFRVVEINTSDDALTSVLIEEEGTEKRLGVKFSDALVQDRDLRKLHASLKSREPVRISLRARMVGDEIRSAAIIKVTTPRK